MIEFMRSTGEDGIECILEFNQDTGTYHLTAQKDNVVLKDQFQASWANPIFGPDMLDIAEANQRIEKLCEQINNPTESRKLDKGDLS